MQSIHSTWNFGSHSLNSMFIEFLYVHWVFLSDLSFPNLWGAHVKIQTLLMLPHLIFTPLFNFHPTLCSKYDPISTLYISSPVNPSHESIYYKKHVSKPHTCVWIYVCYPCSLRVINSSHQCMKLKTKATMREPVSCSKLCNFIN